MRKPTGSERRSAMWFVGSAVVALLAVVILAYAYRGSHVDSITPEAQQRGQLDTGGR
jgi:hypothetical protein